MRRTRSNPEVHDFPGRPAVLQRAGCGQCLEDVLDHTIEYPLLAEERSCLEHHIEGYVSNMVHRAVRLGLCSLSLLTGLLWMRHDAGVLWSQDKRICSTPSKGYSSSGDSQKVATHEMKLTVCVQVEGRGL